MLNFQVPAGVGSAARALLMMMKKRRADSIQVIRGMGYSFAKTERQLENDTPAMEFTLSAIGLRLKGIGRAGLRQRPESLRHFARGADATPLALMAPLKRGAFGDTLEQARAELDGV